MKKYLHFCDLNMKTRKFLRVVSLSDPFRLFSRSLVSVLQS